ncbi:MAG: spore germination protein [Clostridia bacterium]|nr:spore germination protein [Clostridia bacterium]
MNLKNLFVFSSDENLKTAAPEKKPETLLKGSFISDNALLKSEFAVEKNGDVKVRNFTLNVGENTLKATVYFIDGLTDKTQINDFILKPLMIASRELKIQDVAEVWNILLIQSECSRTKNVGEICRALNYGSAITVIEGFPDAIVIDIKEWAKRGVDNPQNENVVRGPADSFTEQIRSNTGILRRLARSSDFIVEEFTVGTMSETPCAIMYMKNIVDTKLLDEVRRRVHGVDVDYISSSAELEALIEDDTYLTLPQILSTERPDRTMRAIYEGRVAIVVDGSPFLLILPTTLFDLNDSPEDYYLRYPYVCMTKLVRTLAFIISLLLSGVYVAAIRFHTELIPTSLLITIISSRANVPFPGALEVVLMEVALEIIREAGIRIPSSGGLTLSIVGALILGQAAVSASLVSPVLIIIVSLTALGSFATPNYYIGLSGRMLRFLYIALGYFGGFLGIAAGLFIHALVWSGAHSVGIPMVAPYAPKTNRGGAQIMSVPIWRREHRPDWLNTKKSRQQPRVARRWANGK